MAEAEALEIFLSAWGFVVEYNMHHVAAAGSDIGENLLTLLWINLASFLVELWRRDTKRRLRIPFTKMDAFLLAKSAAGMGMAVVGVYLHLFHTTRFHPFSRVSFLYSLFVLIFNIVHLLMPHPAPPQQQEQEEEDLLHEA